MHRINIANGGDLRPTDTGTDNDREAIIQHCRPEELPKLLVCMQLN